MITQEFHRILTREMNTIPKTVDPLDTPSKLQPIKPSIYFPQSALFSTSDHPTIQNT
jgi:hypothetical protein